MNQARSIEHSARTSGGVGILLLGLVPVLALLFFYSMGEPLNHNEHMYLAAGHLARDAELYGDFAYLQTPYLPVVYAWIFAALDTTHLLLTGRLVTFLCAAGTAILVLRQARAAAGDGFVALVVLLSFFMNKNVQGVFDESSNYALSMLASLVAFRCMVLGTGDGSVRRGWVLAAGVAIAVAIGVKLTCAPLAAALGAQALLYPRERKLRARFAGVLIPFSLGILIGLAPAMRFVGNDPAAFFFMNVGYHLENSRLFAEAGPGRSRLGFLLEKQVLSASFAIVVACALVAFASRARIRAAVRERAWPRASLALAVLMSVAGSLSAFVPTPPHYPYYAVPLPFALFVLAELCSLAPPVASVRRVLVALALVALGTNLHRYLRAVDLPDGWTPTRVSAIGSRIRASVASAGASGPVATLTPLFALEAGLPIYPQLVTGSFLYRIGDRLPAAALERARGCSASTLRGLLKSEAPSAVFLGLEGELDDAFLEFASQADYAEVAGDFGGGRLFVRLPAR